MITSLTPKNLVSGEDTKLINLSDRIHGIYRRLAPLVLWLSLSFSLSHSLSISLFSYSTNIDLMMRNPELIMTEPWRLLKNNTTFMVRSRHARFDYQLTGYTIFSRD